MLTASFVPPQFGTEQSSGGRTFPKLDKLVSWVWVFAGGARGHAAAALIVVGSSVAAWAACFRALTTLNHVLMFIFVVCRVLWWALCPQGVLRMKIGQEHDGTLGRHVVLRPCGPHVPCFVCPWELQLSCGGWVCACGKLSPSLQRCVRFLLIATASCPLLPEHGSECF